MKDCFQALCFDWIKNKCSVFVRKAAAETFRNSIEKFNLDKAQLNDFLTHYYESYSKYYTAKEGYVLYIVIGSIAKFCYNIVDNLSKHVSFIFKNLIADLRNQHEEKSEKQSEEVKIYMDCISNLLLNFTPFDDSEKNEIYFRQYYEYIQLLCEPQKAQKTFRNKAINTLFVHMEKFSMFILNDHKKWHTLFITILEEKENYIVLNVLGKFYQQIAENVCKIHNEEIFTYFKDYFTNQLSKENLLSIELQLTVSGIGDFIPAFNKYTPLEVPKLYQILSIKASNYHLKSINDTEYFQELSSYTETLAKILVYSENVFYQQIYVIAELCGHLIKKFYQLCALNKNNVLNSIHNTFLHISKLKQNHQNEYFKHFLKEAILWSCSHTLLIDVDVLQELQNLSEPPTCHKNYLPLWYSIFDIENKTMQPINYTLIEEFIAVVIHFIEKLNLNLKTQDCDDLVGTLVSQKAENGIDFRFFINLVDLCKDVYEKIEVDLLQDHIDGLLVNFIQFSYKNPLISGFYKLIEVIFKKCDTSIDISKILSRSTYESTSRYLLDTLKLVHSFPGELQFSCVSLILSAPVALIENYIKDTVQLFEVAFKMGLNDYSLALCALNALENWIKKVDFSESFLKLIVNHTEPYFLISEITNDKLQSLNYSVTESNQTLKEVQKKILLFYGLIDSSIRIDFIHEKSMQTNATWTKKQALPSEIVLPDTSLEVYLDRLLPRIVLLTSCEDHKTKIAACELLHASISLFLGKNILFKCFDDRLCSVVLKLSCDSDEAIKSIYYLLSIQLAHYFSSRLAKDSCASDVFVDSLFNGLSEEFDVGYRDHCSLYLKEFTLWSMKQSTESELFDLQKVVERITGLAGQPSRKRVVAAAVAFNQLHNVLQENSNLVSNYWLDFFYVFVKNLGDFDNAHIKSALDHVVNLVKKRSKFFSEKCARRKKPVEFTDETLPSAQPCNFGLNTGISEVSEKLTSSLKNLFDKMKRYSNCVVAHCCKEFIQFINTYCSKLLNVRDIYDKNEDTFICHQFIHGLIILKDCRFLDFEAQTTFKSGLLQSTILEIFELAKSPFLDMNTCTKFDHNVLEYFRMFIKFSLISYETAAVELLIGTINNDLILDKPSGLQISHGNYFLELYKNLIFDYFLMSPKQTISIIEDNLSESPDKIFDLIEKWLQHAEKLKASSNAEKLSDAVCERCKSLHRLSSASHVRRDALFRINKLAIGLTIDPRRALKLSNGAPSDLSKWIMDELVQSGNFETKSEILQTFLIYLCSVDEENPELELILRQLRDNDYMVWLEKLKNDDLARHRASAYLKIMLEALASTKSPLIFRVLMSYLAGASSLFGIKNLREVLRLFYTDRDETTAFQSLVHVYESFLNFKQSQERWDILREFLLPSIEFNSPRVVLKFYEDKCNEMLSHVSARPQNMSNEQDRIRTMISMTGCYNLFELMLVKFDLPTLEFGVPAKPLNRLLVQHSVQIRQLSASNDREKEATRLLLCAALNCCTAIVCLRKDEKFYKFVFADKLIWDKIVDSDRVYGSSRPSSRQLQGERRKLVNIRRGADAAAASERSGFISQQASLAGLSLLENVHAYDLNDARLVSAVSSTADQRLSMSFESDELNEHECMPMLSGLVIDLFNSRVAKLPQPTDDVSEERMPEWLRALRLGLSACRSNNARLFLLRLLANAKGAFLPYMACLHLALLDLLGNYLATSRRIHRLVRDAVVMLVEAAHRPQDSKSLESARKLIELLLKRSPDDQLLLYEYNLELIEALYAHWGVGTFPRLDFLVQLAKDDPDLGVRALALLLRVDPSVWSRLRGVQLLRDHVSLVLQNRWTELETGPLLLQGFEALGYQLRSTDDVQATQLNWLESLLRDIQRRNVDRAARCAIALYRSWANEELAGGLASSYACPRNAKISDSRRADCLELLLLRLEHGMEASPAIEALERSLVDRWLGCDLAALKLLRNLLQNPFGAISALDASMMKAKTRLDSNHDVAVRLAALECFVAGAELMPQVCLPILVEQLGDETLPPQLLSVILEYWSKLYDKSGVEFIIQLLELLSRHAPRFGATRTLVLVILSMTSKARDASKPMCRQALVEGARFEKYEVPRSLRRSGASARRGLGSIAPLFVPSLVSQLYREQALSATLPTHASLRVLATQNVDIGTSFTTQFENRNVVPEPSQNQLSRREPAAQSRAKPLGSVVELQRRYRIGEYPDVELSYESYATCLRQVIVRDRAFCQNLAVELLLAVAEVLKRPSQNSVESATSGLWDRFVSAALQLQRDRAFSDLAPVLLEIGLRTSEDRLLEFENVAKSCLRSDEPKHLGLLSLERIAERLEEKDQPEQNEPPANKRPRVQNIDRDVWLRLSSTLKSLGQSNVADNLTAHGDWAPQYLREAALASIAEDWLEARKAYEKAREIELEPLVQEHCFDGMIDSLVRLSDWPRAIRCIDERVGLRETWKQESQEAKLLLPRLLLAQLMSAIDDNVNGRSRQSLANQIESSIERDRLLRYMSEYGEELSILHVCDDDAQAGATRITSCLDLTRARWLRISPLLEYPRIESHLKLCRLRDIDAFLAAYQAGDCEEAVFKLIAYWRRCCPASEKHSQLGNASRITQYRQLFVNQLYHKLEDDVESEDCCKQDLLLTNIDLQLSASNLAIQLKNKSVAKKHFGFVEKLIDSCSKKDQFGGNRRFQQLTEEFELSASRFKFMCAQSEKRLEKSCSYYIKSWMIVKDLLAKSYESNTVPKESRYHLANISSALRRVVQKYPSVSDMLISDNFVAECLNVSDAGQVPAALERYAFDNLKFVCESGASESFALFGKYCYELLQSRSDHHDEIRKYFVSSILQGMSFGCLASAHYFPCLLKIAHETDCEQAESFNELYQLFVTGVEKVPSWLFLNWRSQLMSFVVDDRLSNLILPLMQRLIDDYPNALVYSFWQSFKLVPELANRSEIQRMHNQLMSNESMKSFIEAICRVCLPENFLIHHLRTVCESSPENFSHCFEAAFYEISPTRSRATGLLFDQMLTDFRQDIDELRCSNYHNYKERFAELEAKLRKSKVNRLRKKQSLQLVELSSYFGNFSDYDIEVPGQYKPDRKPMPRYHAKIARFDRYVTLMESQFNPCKINIIGSDFKTYSFLIKFGEDLRQDQRLQQIFTITNKSLLNDLRCRERHLKINTYEVLPITNDLGLIQWIDNAKTIKEFINFSAFSDSRKLEEASWHYKNWIDRANTTKIHSNPYKAAMLKYSDEETRAKMMLILKSLDVDYLRKTFFFLSDSLECFLTLRDNFVTSYASMCLVHWLTGIGDRHLENTMICVKTGQCFGIDFGLAFGAGIDQIVPELVPFRLTPQIQNFLKPYLQHGNFDISMCNVLRALRKERAPILACLDVFIHEPFDWRIRLNKAMKEKYNQETRVKWLPASKIDVVKKKLAGCNPSKIMLEELKCSHFGNCDENNEKGLFQRYQSVILGTNDIATNPASYMEEDILTAEQQVNALIKQARDFNALGRMYVGWQPFL
uniref:non-specific serine/threonine protein kinase n=1 Tax=Trichogramma kaykai TaxID=54128 RepID=A0ABD2W9S2_9HYME